MNLPQRLLGWGVGLALWGGSSILGWQGAAVAGGWTQPKGTVFSSVTVRTFDSDTRFDDDGQLRDQENDGSFEKVELEVYVEYGVTDDFTLILKSPYNWLTSSDNSGSDFNSGFVDQELGVRYALARAPLAIALQGTLIIPPGYDVEANPRLGNDAFGVELRVPVSDSFRVGDRFGYWTLEAAYRNYSGFPSDEFRFFGEVALEVVKDLTLSGQFDAIVGLGNGQDEEVGENILLTQDFDLLKLIGNVRYQVNPDVALVVGGFRHVAGRDVGGGGGFEFKVWYTFAP